MIYKLTEDPNVILLDGMFRIPTGNYQWVEYQDWLAAGNTPEPQFSYEEEQAKTQAQFDDAIEALMNTTAQSLGYLNMDRAISYAGASSVVRFQVEGQALLNWRSVVWDYANTQLQLVSDGKRAIPADVKSFISELPAFALTSDETAQIDASTSVAVTE